MQARGQPGGLPSPLIDKLHRMMGLFQRNQGAEVQQLYEEWGLASEPAFPQLLLAIRQLAHEDGRAQEQRLVEAVGSHLKLTRQQVDETGVLKEGPFFPAIDEATRTKVSYRKERK